VLSNSETRAKYDRFGHAAFSNGGGQGFGDFSSFAEDIFGDIFGAFFGTTAGGSRRRSGRDLRYELEITLEEAAFGVAKEIKLTKPNSCETCKGSGARAGTVPETCKQCGGRGSIGVQQGFFSVTRTCPICNGEGRVIVDPCASCGGLGHVNKEQKLSVKIPAGIDEGQRLKIRGEGEPAPTGGIAGDLFVEIRIKPHKFFVRRGQDLLSEVPITYAQAVLGSEVEVATLDGNISLKIQAGTESGKVFRLRGKGIVDMQTGVRGDQHVRAYVYVPKSISDSERTLIEELAKCEGKPVHNESRSFFDKVKEFFE
jgi:molecular chaperone DnaJ